MTSSTGLVSFLNISWSQTDQRLETFTWPQSLTAMWSTEKRREEFCREILRWSRSFENLFLHLSEMGTCKMAEYLIHQNFRYQVYIFFIAIKLPDAIALSSCSSFAMQKNFEHSLKTNCLVPPENFYRTYRAVQYMKLSLNWGLL